MLTVGFCSLPYVKNVVDAYLCLTYINKKHQPHSSCSNNYRSTLRTCPPLYAYIMNDIMYIYNTDVTYNEQCCYMYMQNEYIYIIYMYEHGNERLAG